MKLEETSTTSSEQQAVGNEDARQHVKITTETAKTSFGGITVVNTNTLLSKPHIMRFINEVSERAQKELARPAAKVRAAAS